MISAQVHRLSLKKSFLKDGNRYMKAGNRLDDHNFVTYNDIYPYLAQKTTFGRGVEWLRSDPIFFKNQLKSADFGVGKG